MREGERGEREEGEREERDWGGAGPEGRAWPCCEPPGVLSEEGL